MGFLDALLGRTKPAQPDLDRLFGLPGARITLDAAEGLVPTRQAGVCFKPSVGQAFTNTEAEMTDHLDEGADEFGYRWIVLGADDFDTLVTRVHLVNSTLQDHGYGPQLLASVFGFTPKPGADTTAAQRLYLVYLYKRGSFYPFVPLAGEKRDNEAELRLKTELAQDLTIEKDLDRWFPLWNLPLQ
jgi:hypothetical protein